MLFNSNYRLKVLTLLLILFVSCSETIKAPHNSEPEASANQFAKGFEITHDDLDFYTVKFFDPSGNQAAIFRLHHKDVIPPTNEDIPSIVIPVESVACQSTTHTAFFSFLNKRNVVNGVAYAHLIQNQFYKEQLENGKMKNLSSSEEIDFEILMGIQPDILTVYPYGENNFDKFQEAGIPCIPISEYLEETPLGQAEWIKIFGLLLDEYDLALEEFEKLRSRYVQIVESSQEMALKNEKPSVFTGSFWKGNWKAPSGNSLIAKYIQDAGGEYVFGDYLDKGNLELDFEEFFARSFDADFFGKVVYEGDTITSEILIDQDQRLREIKSYKDKNMFYCNAGKTDYFGDAIMHPDIILQDLNRIFWDLESDSLNTYFFKIENEE